ncbi:MAG TPA: hypothetical protein VFN35_23375 [Ktedonobacteraceae bacterium]|nr:hypothetical protein [Ktedonobacteraceae bacterium]
MPKARKRKKAKNRASTVVVQEQTAQTLPVRPRVPARRTGAQNLMYSVMVAVGFWGLAIFCIFFFAADPNHYLYGAIMGLTAVGWSVIVGRRWLAYRQRA